MYVSDITAEELRKRMKIEKHMIKIPEQEWEKIQKRAKTKKDNKIKQFIQKNGNTLLIVGGIIAFCALDIGLKYAAYKLGEKDMAFLIGDAIAKSCKDKKALSVVHNGKKILFSPQIIAGWKNR